jgi:undecaprenyl-diphosphatase
LLKYTIVTTAAGAALVVAAKLASSALARILASGPVAAWDQAIAASIHTLAFPPVLWAMAWVSHLHGTAGILGLGALAAAWLAGKGRPDQLAALFAAIPGGLLLNVAVKNAIQRARPDTLHAAERLATFSFPSGHTAGATVFYGFMVAMLWPRCGSAARVALAASAAALVTLVAASRIMLGMHYPSDCIGAVVEGTVWLTFCVMSAKALRP